MAVGVPPYVAGNQIALAEKICHRQPPAMPSTCSPALQWLVRAALAKSPEKRPTMVECFQVASSCCCAPLRRAQMYVPPHLVHSLSHTQAVCRGADT
jgi:hypothetical protein